MLYQPLISTFPHSHISTFFIRWKLVMRADQYELNCEYGLYKNGTNGFRNGTKVMFSGKIIKQGHYYQLQRDDKIVYLFQVNSNLLHLADKNKNLLVGNGGHSYVLNIDIPFKTDQFNMPPTPPVMQDSVMFEGRTPCQELSRILQLNKGAACNKMKWGLILFRDPVTH